MKYDHTKKTNRFAARTLKDFSTTMFSLLKDKPFESITVLQICQIANYPRATFYNYFEDKYDLLEYCWSLIKDQIRLEEALDICHPHETFELFGRLYDCFKEHKKLLTKIMAHNPVEGELFADSGIAEYSKRDHPFTSGCFFLLQYDHVGIGILFFGKKEDLKRAGYDLSSLSFD